MALDFRRAWSFSPKSIKQNAERERVMRSKLRVIGTGASPLLSVLVLMVGFSFGSEVKVEKKFGATILRWDRLEVLILSNDALSTALYNGKVLYKSTNLYIKTRKYRVLAGIGNPLKMERMRIQKKRDGLVVITGGVIGEGGKGPGKWNYKRVLLCSNSGEMGIRYVIKRLSPARPPAKMLHYMINFPAGYSKKATISVSADAIRVKGKGWQKIESLHEGKFGGIFRGVNSCEFSSGDLRWSIKFPEGSYLGRTMSLNDYGYCCRMETALHNYQSAPDILEVSITYDFSNLIASERK